MGQYWEWLCLGKEEKLGTHELSYGLKWFEQFSASGMYSGIMMLKTDVSSLGHGGGDLQVDEVPAPLQPLIKAVLGRWTGDIIELAGDYGEIAEKSAGDAGDEFTDISPNVAAAVFSVYHEYWYDSDKSADDNIESLKHKLPEHPDFEYYSVNDKKFVRLIEMALKPAASSGNSGEDKKPVAGSGKSKKAAASSSAAAASPSDAASDGNRGIKRRKT